MTAAYYQAGEAEAKLDELYAARQRAMKAWDATAFNCIDSEIKTVLAVMHAEQQLGLREPAFLSFAA